MNKRSGKNRQWQFQMITLVFFFLIEFSYLWLAPLKCKEWPSNSRSHWKLNIKGSRRNLQRLSLWIFDRKDSRLLSQMFFYIFSQDSSLLSDQSVSLYSGSLRFIWQIVARLRETIFLDLHVAFTFAVLNIVNRIRKLSNCFIFLKACFLQFHAKQPEEVCVFRVVAVERGRW